MTFGGICRHLGFLKEDIESLLAVGSIDEASKLIRRLKEDSKRYLGSDQSRKYLNLQKKVRMALDNKERIMNGPFNKELLSQELLMPCCGSSECDVMYRGGFSLHKDERAYSNYNNSFCYRGWSEGKPREGSKKSILVNEGAYNLVKNTERGSLAILFRDPTFRILYQFIAQYFDVQGRLPCKKPISELD